MADTESKAKGGKDAGKGGKEGGKPDKADKAPRPEKGDKAQQAQGAPKGPATVIYPPQQQNTKFPYFVDYVERYLIAKYGPETVFRGGLPRPGHVLPAGRRPAPRVLPDRIAR